jgi:deazaflavin-dependent oxidoreductase (nitroreductase family)
MSPTTTRPRPGGLQRRMLRAPVLLYRWHLGRLLGQRFLLLTSVGRRTGRPRQTVLEVAGRSPSGEWYVVAGWGERSDWVLNCRAAAPVELRVGRHRGRPSVRFLDPGETLTLLREYERKHPRALRMLARRLPPVDADLTQDPPAAMARVLPALAFGLPVARASAPPPRRS